MKFEHLIQINDPLNPFMDALTLAQLWHGLVLRARQPTLFMPHLDACRILDSRAASLTRSLHYGELVIIDRVELTPHQEVRYLIDAQQDIPASSLYMTIEESQPGHLFVRFQYQSDHSQAGDADHEMVDSFRRSAYQESDIDTIRIIRELAAQGKLDQLPEH